MLIQEEEEVGKRPFGGGPKSGGGREGTSEGPVGPETFFSSRGQARGYKAQRDGLGESCTLAVSACSRSPTRPSPSLFFLLLSRVHLLLLPFPPFSLHLAPRGMARLFSMRQFNDATRPRLFAVAGEKRAQGGKHGDSRAREISSAIEQIHRTRGRVARLAEIDFTFLRARSSFDPHPWNIVANPGDGVLGEL